MAASTTPRPSSSSRWSSAIPAAESPSKPPSTMRQAQASHGDTEKSSRSIEVGTRHWICLVPTSIPGPCTINAVFEISIPSRETPPNVAETRSEFRYKFEAASSQQPQPRTTEAGHPHLVSSATAPVLIFEWPSLCGQIGDPPVSLRCARRWVDVRRSEILSTGGDWFP